jgi:hypothetical protein
MRERRHHGRLSSKFLPPQTSLYNAMQAIIGAELRERYDMTEQLPSDLERLLGALKDAHSSSAKPPEPSSASGTGGETPGAGGAPAAVGVDNRRSR